MKDSQKGGRFMAALSLFKPKEQLSTIHQELVSSNFLGAKKLTKLEAFLYMQGIYSLREVTLSTVRTFYLWIMNQDELSDTQKKTYSSALETATRCYYETLETELLAECKLVDMAPHFVNKNFFFLSINHIHHLDEITACLRIEYASYLQLIGITHYHEFLRNFDSLKLFALSQDTNAIRKKEFTYANEIFYIGYHPDYQIASLYLYTQKRGPLFFDFSIDAPIVLKKQIFTCMKYFTEEFENKDNHYRIQHFIQPLWNFYNFCIKNEFTDIAKFTSRDEESYHQYLLEIGKSYLASEQHILGVIRKYLFLSAPNINWDSNVWYFEKFNFKSGRVNEANPVEALYFDDIKLLENAKLLMDYMKYLIRLSPRYSVKSIYDTYKRIKEFLYFLDENDSLLKEIDALSIERFINEYHKRGNKASSVNGQLGAMKTFIEFLTSKNLIHPIIFPFEKYRVQEVIQHNHISVSEDYVDEILSAIGTFPEELRLMVLNLWCVGLRANEVCTIKANSYTFDGTDAWFLVYQAKAKREKRVPIPMELYKMMRDYITRNHIEKDDFVFRAPRVGGPYRVGTFTKQVRERLAEYGLPFRSHSFRHTVATDLYGENTSIQTIREYLGHSNVNMTKQYIDHLPNEIDKKNTEFFHSKEAINPWEKI